MSSSPIIGFHHITMNVGGAQEDYDFHVKLLGLRMVKKTILFDGTRPVYHLYYGNERGEEFIRNAKAFMTSQGIRNPERLLHMYTPGFFAP